MSVCVSCPKCNKADWVVGDLPNGDAGVQFACSCGHVWINTRWPNVFEFVDAYMTKEVN